MDYWPLIFYGVAGALWSLWMERNRVWRNWQLVVAFTAFLPHTLLWAVSLLIALGVVKLLHWLMKEV